MTSIIITSIICVTILLIDIINKLWKDGGDK